MKNRFRESGYTPDRPLEITIFLDTGTLELGALSTAIEYLRRQIAVVTQNVILFDVTVQTNIAYGDTAATSESVRQEANAALADDFVSALPDRYETRIGERGLRLSGGERHSLQFPKEV